MNVYRISGLNIYITTFVLFARSSSQVVSFGCFVCCWLRGRRSGGSGGNKKMDLVSWVIFSRA